MQHAKLSPSSSARWLSCTASVKASERYENKSNAASSWGTACHALGELSLKGEPAPLIGAYSEGVEIDKEMVDTAEEYADYCRSLMTPESVVLIEERFDLSFIAPNTFGTGDCTILNGDHLHIIDLKTGHNIVDAEENTQLMLYALGAINELEDLYDVDKITLHIAQGRANHYSTWDTDIHRLAAFATYAFGQADDIINDNIEFSPNAKACKWCPHQADCEALKEHVDAMVTGEFDDIEELEGNADKVSTEHMKKILDNADLIIGFVNAVKEVALERMEAGEKIEGYKIVESKTNRKWRDEDEVAKYLNRKIKADELYVKKLIPMTKILKMRPNDKKLEAMLVKPEGKPTLAPESDKRPAIGAVCDEFEEIR